MKLKYTLAKFSKEFLEVTFNSVDYKETHIDHIESFLELIREHGNTAVITAYEDDLYQITIFDVPKDEWKPE